MIEAKKRELSYPKITPTIPPPLPFLTTQHLITIKSCILRFHVPSTPTSAPTTSPSALPPRRQRLSLILLPLPIQKTDLLPLRRRSLLQCSLHNPTIRRNPIKLPDTLPRPLWLPKGNFDLQTPALGGYDVHFFDSAADIPKRGLDILDRHCRR